jgi:hypothetical protein
MRHAKQESGTDEIRAVVARLGRPHRSGGTVVERAAILAEGERSGAILDWIVAHAGEPELAAAANPARGLHDRGGTAARGPARYVLPAGALAFDSHAPGDPRDTH